MAVKQRTRRQKRTGKTKKGQEPMLVRIYPRDPQRGYHAASFRLANSGYPIFRVERGWYEVDPQTAERLRQYRNRNNTGQPIFQIVTRAEAKALERAEKEAIRRADANSPIPMPGRHAQVDWDEDMGASVTDDDEEDFEPVDRRSESQTKFVPMSQLDYDDDEDEEEDLEEPPELDLLSELDDEEEEAKSSDLTTSDLKPRSTRRAAPKKTTAKRRAPAKKTPAKKSATRRAAPKKTAAKKPAAKKTSRKKATPAKKTRRPSRSPKGE